MGDDTKVSSFFVLTWSFRLMCQKSKKEKNLKNLKITLVEILFVLLLIYAVIQFFDIYQDYQCAVKEYNNLSDQVITLKVIDSIQEKSEEKLTEEVENILDLPYDYKVPSFSMNLERMKVRNPDTVGWIILPDSKLNYPIVKSKDNTEYLTTTFEGKKSNSGAIFMEMLCEEDFSSKNTIIYGHNMKNGSMFRALNNMTDKEFFWRHHIFCLNLGNGFENYEVISCYETVETDTRSWRISFEDDADYENWLKDIANRCDYECTNYDRNKNTITLSTCRGKSGGSGRFIVHLQKKN